MFILILCITALAQQIHAAALAQAPIFRTLGNGETAASTGPEFVPISPASKAATSLEDYAYWLKKGLNQLERTINLAKKSKDEAYKRKARNIIIFVGDGMGLSTITAGRIYKGQYLKHGNGEEEMLSFDEFPFTGLAKTYNVDRQVPDSAGTATAMFCGIKTAYGAVGMDMTRSKTNGTQGRLKSIIDWAQAEGKRTGVVTNTRITHATPACTYARIYHRDWECDGEVPAESRDAHADIARQLVEQAPGNKLNVIMGGGLAPMGALNTDETQKVKFEGSFENVCQRSDQRNLTAEWLALSSTDSSAERVFVQTREQLQQVELEKVDHLMGLFRNNHITFAIAREAGEPSLQEMTEAAIKVLERGTNSNGYVLVVEGGRIDQGHHQNYARAALHEVYEMDLAVEAALKATNSDETLIIVTADHSHAVTLNGYPMRGSDILGFANTYKPNDPLIYETITYANGPGYYDHLANGTYGANVWLPLTAFTAEQLNAPNYRHMATLPLKDESHGGEDVAVFAQGPGASLVRGVFEQNYLAYVMSYAGCMGPARDFDETCKAAPAPRSGANANVVVWSLLIFSCASLSAIYV